MQPPPHTSTSTQLTLRHYTKSQVLVHSFGFMKQHSVLFLCRGKIREKIREKERKWERVVGSRRHDNGQWRITLPFHPPCGDNSCVQSSHIFLFIDNCLYTVFLYGEHFSVLSLLIFCLLFFFLLLSSRSTLSDVLLK